jgi:phosphoribosyl 1,2-cyclic phosphodiesterase
MRVISLQSGSNGNCVYVEAGKVALLFDAGISGVQAQQRLARHGIDIHQVDAVLISHDHADHSRAAGVFHRKFKLPIYATPATFLAASTRYRLGEIDEVRFFHAGTTLRLGGVRVETIPTPHDGVDGVAFVIDDGRRRFGILTDLGHVFSDLDAIIRSLDAVLLESNYDPTMLDQSDYPESLKRRIRGPHGHLSNVEAAELLLGSATRRLQWACLGHLSHENNHPTVALATHREILGPGFPLRVATRYEASDLMEV